MSSIKTTHIDGDVSIGRNHSIGGSQTVQGNSTIKGNVIVKGWLEAYNHKGADKGWYRTKEALESAYPQEELQAGWWAVVGESASDAIIYLCESSDDIISWVSTEKGFAISIEDTYLGQSIIEEANAREEADTVLQSAIESNEAAISAESNRAESAESALQSGIDTLNGKLDNVYDRDDVDTIIDNLDARVAANHSGLMTESNRAESAEAALQEQIESVRTMAVTNNQLAVTNGADIRALEVALLEKTESVTLTVSPSAVFRGVETAVTVKASASFETTDLTLLKDDETISKESAVSELSCTDTVSITSAVTYGAVATKGQATLQASQKLQVVDPVYAGAGEAYTDVVLDENRQTVRTSAAGTYTVEVANDGDYVWFLVPRSFAAVKKATLSGFDFPLETAIQVYVGGSSALTGGIAYSAYRSSNQYAAGTLTIVLS